MPARSYKSSITWKRAGAGALPIHGIVCSDIQPFPTPVWQRAAGWNVERVVREPKVVPAIKWLHQCSPATSANTRGIHPASASIDHATSGRRGPALTRNCVFRHSPISHTSLASRSGVECRVGGTGAESGAGHQMVALVFTGDFGKHARHPPRKRKVMRNRGQAQRPAPTNGF